MKNETLKLVISGSASLQNELSILQKELKDEYEILDFPKFIPQKNFKKIYRNVHKEFFENINKADVFLLFNADKNGIDGYIGAESFAELCFAVVQKLINNKNVSIYIYKKPSSKVQCYNEIMLWLDLGWIEIWQG